jgi:hypothetical protein
MRTAPEEEKPKKRIKKVKPKTFFLNESHELPKAKKRARRP